MRKNSRKSPHKSNLQLSDQRSNFPIVLQSGTLQRSMPVHLYVDQWINFSTFWFWFKSNMHSEIHWNLPCYSPEISSHDQNLLSQFCAMARVLRTAVLKFRQVASKKHSLHVMATQNWLKFSGIILTAHLGHHDLNSSCSQISDTNLIQNQV